MVYTSTQTIFYLSHPACSVAALLAVGSRCSTAPGGRWWPLLWAPATRCCAGETCYTPLICPVRGRVRHCRLPARLQREFCAVAANLTSAVAANLRRGRWNLRGDGENSAGSASTHLINPGTAAKSSQTARQTCGCGLRLTATIPEYEYSVIVNQDNNYIFTITNICIRLYLYQRITHFKCILLKGNLFEYISVSVSTDTSVSVQNPETDLIFLCKILLNTLEILI